MKKKKKHFYTCLRREQLNTDSQFLVSYLFQCMRTNDTNLMPPTKEAKRKSFKQPC